MKKIWQTPRQTFKEMENGLLDLKQETLAKELFYTNWFLIATIYLTVCFSSMIFMAFDLAIVSYIIIAITVLMLATFTLNDKLFWKLCPLSGEIIIYFYGRYGKVVTKEDWNQIKKKCHKLYRDIWWSKRYYGHCYFFAWCVALFLEDAEIMICSIDKGNGERTGHAVIVKDNCVFDTNNRNHFELDEYKKTRNVLVYKMFSKKEYRSKTFFEDIREDFTKWCKENNSYCNPE